MKEPAKSKANPHNHHIDDDTKRAAWDELIRMQIRGATRRQCAATLGFSYSTIGYWQRDPAFQIQMRRTRALIFTKTRDAGDQAAEDAYQDIRKVIDAYAKEAVEKTYNLMQSAEKERDQLKAAEMLMDRSAETQKSHKVEHQGGVMLFSPEALARMFQTAKEIVEDEDIGRHIEAVELDTRMLPLPEEEE